MQLQGGELGSHNTKETKSSNRLWINRWLDHHQNQKKCGIVEKDNTQTPKNKSVYSIALCNTNNVYNVYM
jgi:hypothetical protein